MEGFDEPIERIRLEARSRPCLDREGHEAVVFDLGPQCSWDKPKELWHSINAYPDPKDAIGCANKYRDAVVAQRAKIHELKRRRRDALPDALDENVRLQDETEAERRKLGRKLKDLKEDHRRLIEEAQKPQVEMKFSETLGGFKLVIIQGGAEETDDGQGELFDEALEEHLDNIEEQRREADQGLVAWSSDPDESAPAPASEEPEVPQEQAPAPPRSRKRCLGKEETETALREAGSKSGAALALGVSVYRVKKAIREFKIDADALLRSSGAEDNVVALKTEIDTTAEWPDDEGDGE